MKSLIVVISFSGLCYAQATYIRSVKGPATGQHTNATATLDCHDGNFVAVIVSDYLQAVNGTLSSTPSNTWLSKASRTDGGNSNIRAFWAENASVSSSINLTYSGGNYPTLVGICASGVLASGSQDQYSGGANPQAYAQFGVIGSISPASNGEIIITAATSDETTGTFGGWYLANTSTLNGAINNSQTSITVTSGANFPNASVIQCENEQMLVVSGGGTTTLVVTRGYNASVAASHTNGQYVGVQDATYLVVQHQQVTGTSDAIAVAYQDQAIALPINLSWTGYYSGTALTISFKPTANTSTPASILSNGIAASGVIH